MTKTRLGMLIMLLVANVAVLSLLAWFALRARSGDATAALSVQLAGQDVPNGLRRCEVTQDGSTEPAEMDGFKCRVALRRSNTPGYMYFAFDPALRSSQIRDAVVTVEYFDYAPGEFRLNYDGVDLTQNRPSRYMSAEEREKCVGSQQWRKARFLARNPRFQHSQNGGADFRIELRIPELYVRRVTVQWLNEN
jgi:hypothetical protein